MISLRKAADELERQDDLLRTAQEYYARILRTCGDSAVEFESRAADDLREQTRSLEAQFRRGFPVPEFAQTLEALRERLRTYQILGNERIVRMREDLKSATAAMKVFADNVSASAADQDLRLRLEVHRLDDLAGVDDLSQMRTGIKQVSAAILESHLQFDRSNRVVISQLRDEIRTLHQAMDTERQRRFTDPTSGALNRQAITERIDILLANNEPFCALVLGIKNWKRMQGQYSSTARQAALRAFLGEFQKCLGEEPMVGRWGEQLFLGVIEGSPASALSISTALKNKLPKSYTVPDGAAVCSVKLDSSIGILDRQAGIDPARFYAKLAQLAETLV
jgi:GGDEF domain-containing protein